MKRIIVCFDGKSSVLLILMIGTWCAADEPTDKHPTNVTLLCNAIRPTTQVEPGYHHDPDVEQLIHYVPGIGSHLGLIERLRCGATGDGLIERIFEGYNYVGQNWKANDEIYLFGFSRGAYTAPLVR